MCFCYFIIICYFAVAFNINSKWNTFDFFFFLWKYVGKGQDFKRQINANLSSAFLKCIIRNQPPSWNMYSVYIFSLDQPTGGGFGCDQQVYSYLLLPCRTPVPSCMFHLQLLKGYGESPSSVISDGHGGIFITPIRTCRQAGSPVTTPTPFLLTFSVGGQTQGSHWKLVFQQCFDMNDRFMVFKCDWEHFQQNFNSCSSGLI